MSKTLELNAESVGILRIPRDAYKLRVQEEPKFKVSSKGNAMLVFKTETVEPQTKLIDGVERKIAGTEFTIWATTFKNDDGNEVNPTMQAIHQACKLPLNVSFDEETGIPEGISYAGLEFWAICYSEETEQKNEAGEVIRNPNTGEPLKGYNRRVGQIFS